MRTVSRHAIERAIDRQRVRLAIAECRAEREPESNFRRVAVRWERQILRDLEQALTARHRTLQ